MGDSYQFPEAIFETTTTESLASGSSAISGATAIGINKTASESRQSATTIASIAANYLPPEHKNFDANKALASAAENGHAQVVHLLLNGWISPRIKPSRMPKIFFNFSKAKAADVNSYTRSLSSGNKTSLHYALEDDRRGLVELLLGHHANIEAKTSAWRWTALLLAASHGRVDIAQLLLGRGANTKSSDSRGNTALLVAAHKGHEQMTRLLLENGANIKDFNISGKTALMQTVKGAHPEFGIVSTKARRERRCARCEKTNGPRLGPE